MICWLGHLRFPWNKVRELNLDCLEVATSCYTKRGIDRAVRSTHGTNTLISMLSFYRRHRKLQVDKYLPSTKVLGLSSLVIS